MLSSQKEGPVSVDDQWRFEPTMQEDSSAFCLLRLKAAC